MNLNHIGRLAPSPTGLLHIGNAWAFYLAWLDVRKIGGKLILRMEDLDPKRSRQEFGEKIKDDLLWLGIDWDEEVTPQGRRGEEYEHALNMLKQKELLYPCFCTRKELRSLAGAPQIGDAGAMYLGTCRKLTKGERELKIRNGFSSTVRIVCPNDRAWVFDDAICGHQSLTIGECGNDFALRRSDGVFAYQLAVVVDDLEQSVSSVVRGDDLLTSTPRQLFLYECLGGNPPHYAHLPLVVDYKGERLAKRHHSLSLKCLRERGLPPENILGFLAYESGLKSEFLPIKAEEGLVDFSFAKILKKKIILPEDIEDLLFKL